jgi:hypothetical protein
MILALLVITSWQKIDDQGGILLEARAVQGSPYEELRVTAHAEVAPERLIEAAWGKANDQGGAREVQRRDVLDDFPRERVYYELVNAPLVSNRDFVMRSQRKDDAAMHVYEIAFHTVDDPRRPQLPGVVRMEVRGSCTISAAEGGGSDIVYIVYSHLGGSLPAWVATGKQRESAVQWVKDRITRARK